MAIFAIRRYSKSVGLKIEDGIILFMGEIMNTTLQRKDERKEMLENSLQ